MRPSELFREIIKRGCFVIPLSPLTLSHVLLIDLYVPLIQYFIQLLLLRSHHLTIILFLIVSSFYSHEMTGLIFFDLFLIKVFPRRMSCVRKEPNTVVSHPLSSASFGPFLLTPTAPLPQAPPRSSRPSSSPCTPGTAWTWTAPGPAPCNLESGGGEGEKGGWGAEVGGD